jgi:hypothetical protein
VNTCGTCKHWGTARDADISYRQCTGIIHDTSTATIDDDDIAWMDEDERAPIEAIRKHAAVVRDGSGYHASVRCRSDFGCVLWKSKTQGGKP